MAGNPVGDTPAFVGRADMVREVKRILRRPQDNAIVLYGQRRVGKTSILQHLVAQLPNEGPYYPLIFDLQDKASWPLGRVLHELARTIAHTLGQPDPDLGTEPETTFRQTWLPAVLNDLPAGSALVLLFDEFDVLADPKGEQAAAAFFPYLRDLLTTDPQRLNFVFVIGRNVDDLTNIALSLFKGTASKRISLLSREATTNLIRLSEANDSLHWADEAIDQVWALTHGHPFLAQNICSHVWERAYDEEPEEAPTVREEDVEAVIDEVLETSRNTLEWLWDGLSPAARVVSSALAEAGPKPIAQDDLERRLHESGVRVVIRDLKNAPRQLEDWDILEAKRDRYRFRVELLRRWIAAYKPLQRVQEELDRIEPVAQSYYRAALGLYQAKELEQAIDPLRRAIRLNPNHLGAMQLLSDIFLSQGKLQEAKELLEQLYEYQPAATRSCLVQVLLLQAKNTESDDERLILYERIIEMDHAPLEAISGKQRIWEQRGDSALEAGDLEAALQAYKAGGLGTKVADVEEEQRRRDLNAGVANLQQLIEKEAYKEAQSLAHELAEKYPDDIDWSRVNEDLTSQIQLAELYERALEAVRSEEQEKAQSLLLEVIIQEPAYKEATRYLHQVVTGVDIAELRHQLEAEKEARNKAEAEVAELEGLEELREEDPEYWQIAVLRIRLETEKKARKKAEAEVATLQRQMHLKKL